MSYELKMFIGTLSYDKEIVSVVAMVDLCHVGTGKVGTLDDTASKQQHCPVAIYSLASERSERTTTDNYHRRLVAIPALVAHEALRQDAENSDYRRAEIGLITLTAIMERFSSPEEVVVVFYGY